VQAARYGLGPRKAQPIRSSAAVRGWQRVSRLAESKFPRTLHSHLRELNLLINIDFSLPWH
jgi:hypothetical protein